LLITSNLYSVKKLWKNWKKIQRLTYPYFISGWIIAAQYEPKLYYGTMGMVALLYAVNIIQKYLKNKNI
jgi:DMSO/TMAO reductase YedYZ heme-binding membrane subunit